MVVMLSGMLDDRTLSDKSRALPSVRKCATRQHDFIVAKSIQATTTGARVSYVRLVRAAIVSGMVPHKPFDPNSSALQWAYPMATIVILASDTRSLKPLSRLLTRYDWG